MKKSIYFVSLLMTVAALSQVDATVDPIPQSNRLAKTGGYIMAPHTGPNILIVNAQKRISAGVIRQNSEEISRILRVPIQFKEEEKVFDPMKKAADVLRDKSIAVLLILGDTPHYPTMLVAPEARWVVLNTAALETEGINNPVLEIRVSKEMWRAFGMVLGGGVSSYPDCLMQPIFKAEQLDDLKGKAISPDPLMRMFRTITKLGIKPQRLTTYRKACEEGWAPMPTNSFQKAIWDEVKTKK